MRYTVSDPNVVWSIWKSYYTETLNKHAPLRHKRTKVNAVPWMTAAIRKNEN